MKREKTAARVFFNKKRRYIRLAVYAVLLATLGLVLVANKRSEAFVALLMTVAFIGFEIFHSRVRTPVLATLPCIGGSVHVREQGDFLYSQGIDYNMNVDIAAVVMTIGVGADKGLVSAKMCFAKFHA